jgi:hypothetical protein
VENMENLILFVAEHWEPRINLRSFRIFLFTVSSTNPSIQLGCPSTQLVFGL